VVTRASAGAGLRSHHYAANADASSEIFASRALAHSGGFFSTRQKESLPPQFSGGTLNGVKISYDPVKRAKTLKERGLDFADAAEVFAGEFTVAPDDRRDYGEDRFISAGYLRGRMVVIVWTLRDDARHIISMRYCHAKEKKLWREKN
jgi:uncharacterized DUF497 family protein